MRDINHGINKKWYLLLFPMLVVAIQMPAIQDSIHLINTAYNMPGKGTVMDYIMYCMQGMNVYKFDPKEAFQIPIHWFMIQIYAAYFVANYAYDDYAGNGKNIFIACRDRSSWWISKCLWCICAVLVYYATVFFSIYVSATYYGAEPSLRCSKEIGANILSGNLLGMSARECVIVAIIVPVVVTIGVSMLQMLLSFIISSVVSFAIVAGMYVVSAYYTSWFLVGSYTMILRSNYITKDGMVSSTGLMLGAAMIFATVGFGKIYFEERDIL